MEAESVNTPVNHSRNESLKTACPMLTGTIAATLADATTDHFSDDDGEFLKFHGVYQADDRDLRKAGKRYIFLIRARVPGGWPAPSTI